MKRGVNYTILALFLIVFSVCTAALGWLLGTTDGARWLLGQVVRQTGLKMAVARTEGRIWNDLRLQGITLRIPGMDIGIGALRLRWRPYLLPTGRVSVRDLDLREVRVRDARPVSKEPPSLAWPKVSGIPSWLTVRVRSLRLTGLDYRRLNEPPVTADLIAARIIWRNSLLTLRDLSVSVPDAGVSGEVMAGFREPSLLLNLTLSPKRPVREMDTFRIDARLFPAPSPEQAAGPVRITGAAGRRERLKLAAEMGIAKDFIRVRQLSVTQPGRRGAALGDGSLAFRGVDPFLRLRIGFDALDLSPEVAPVKALSGVIVFEGTPRDYTGRFALSNADKGWSAARLSGAWRGNESGLGLSGLDGSILDGRLTGNARIRWKDGMSLSGALSARNLNPAKVDPQWSGTVNLDLAASANRSPTAPLRAEVRGRLLESRLHGRVLRGEVDARLEGENVAVNRLLLEGKGFDVRAGGELRNRLSLRARVSDLSGLVPGTGGMLDLEGWVRLRNRRPSGSLSGKGRDIRAGQLGVKALAINARLSDAPGYPVKADCDLRGPAYGGRSVDTLRLKAAGNLERHNLTAELRAPGFEFLTTVTGAYAKGRWRGEITRFQGRDDTGPWRLRAPAVLRMAEGTWTLSPMTITGAGPERLDLRGEVKPDTMRAVIGMQWRELNLARFSRLIDKGRISGATSGTVRAASPGDKRLSLTCRADAAGAVLTEGHRITVRKFSIAALWNERGMNTTLDLRLAEGGMLRGRVFSPEPARMAVPNRGGVEADWEGFDLALLRPWLPAGLDLKGILTGRVRGNLQPGYRFDVSGNSGLARGAVRWENKGSLLTAAVRTADFSLAWRGRKGKAAAGAPEGRLQTDRLALKGLVEASGTLVTDGHRMTVQHTSLAVDWNDRRMSTDLDLRLAEGGRLTARFSSPQPVLAAVPDRGDIEADWKDFDLALLRPWLPAGLDLKGLLAGEIRGRLLPGARVDVRGSSRLTRAGVSWVKENSEFAAAVRTAELSWTWRGAELSGGAEIALEEYGSVRSNFRLPLVARLPAAMDPKGALAVNCEGKIKETGLLHRLFPGLVQESHGEMEFSLQAGGNWQKPEVGGSVRLADAGAYLPAAGVRLKNAGLSARLSGDRIIVDSFQVTSDPGSLNGNMMIMLKDRQVAGYQGTINGDRFRAVYLPELQVLLSPRLNFSGTPRKVAVRGEIQVPELLVSGQTARAPVGPSSDVVLEGAPQPAEKEPPMAMDVQVRVALGDRVRVKTRGIDAQLKGALNLAFTRLDEIRSTGEIRVVKGNYKTYGVNLDITRGRIFYAGGPINQPTLDIRAMRKVGDVQAGVTVSGTPATLTVKLYSEPTMPDVDILSYIVLGHPTTYSGEEAGLMARAAGALLSSSQAMAVQDQLKSRLGLDVLEVKAAAKETPTYRPIQTTPPGAAPTKPAVSTVAETMLTVGKYLTPDLYISYGRSLFTDANLFRLRYTISKRWEIETQTGTESGADIYYKIFFK